MNKLEKIYEGKAKILYTTEDPNLLIQYFKDDATAFNAQKRGTILEKGIMNNRIAANIFEYLGKKGVKTHYVNHLSDRDMLVKKVSIVPIEVIVRNRAAGSMCRLLGLAEGLQLACPVLEFCYKKDELGDPLINEYHVRALNIATDAEVKEISSMALHINTLLKAFFLDLNIELIDFKLEFGRTKEGIVLADEISPDTCRLWEVGTGYKLDKDRFRRDLGNPEGAYKEVLRRITQ